VETQTTRHRVNGNLWNGQSKKSGKLDLGKEGEKRTKENSDFTAQTPTRIRPWVKKSKHKPRYSGGETEGVENGGNVGPGRMRPRKRPRPGTFCTEPRKG